MSKELFIAASLLIPGVAHAEDFHSWASIPPSGWNSWDCFGTTVTEAQVKQQADVMAADLREYGWEYIVVDIQWYEPSAKGFDYQPNARLTMDDFSRLLPALEKFPSAAGGKGFKPLADYVHAKGLKFGIHMMRGIPRQAVERKTPIAESGLTAADIADTSSICPWNPDMYGVDMSKPGAQAYYDSLYALFASWGVDYLKVDDISRPYDSVQQAEIEAIRKAIDKTGRPIVLSLSPGETPLRAGAHVKQHANLWRISDDFWDDWGALLSQFKRLHEWTQFRSPGAWPDADMLPLGAIRQVGSSAKRPPHTLLTRDEQQTLMSLWCIARSPLMYGGDMTKLDKLTLDLLTNREVLEVNRNSSNNRQLFRTPEGLVAWLAEVPESGDRYLALFNTTNSPADVPVDIVSLGFQGSVNIRNLWRKQTELEHAKDRFSAHLPPHGSGLYRVSASRN